MLRIATVCFALICQFAHCAQTYTETLYPEWGQTFEVDEVLFESKTDQQHLIIFENALFGRVLALDGIIQVTERDEFVYHEMLSHVPLLAHGNAKSVLIIGGGDGGMLREVLRHGDVEKVTQVEIDQAVIDMSVKYLPHISRGSFDDPRAHIVIQDGAEFVEQTEETFDVIIIDSTDPIGPGEALFRSSFYESCHRCLADGGIVVTQNGVPFLQQDELIASNEFLKEHFADVAFYMGVIPTYVGGFMTFGWASDNPELREISEEVLKERMEKLEGEFKYYTPAIHKASFALPQFIVNQIES